MPLLQIAKLGNPILRRSAAQVTKDELQSDIIQKLLDDMIVTIRDNDGVVARDCSHELNIKSSNKERM